MEKVCEKLCYFLVHNLSPFLTVLADSETPLPALTDANTHVGSINLASRLNQLCYIVPDSQTIEDLSLSSQEQVTTVDVFVFVQNTQREVLFRQALRYGAAIKRAVQSDYTINGNFSEADVFEMEYFDNVEGSDGDIRAVRLGIRITEEIEEE